MMLHKSTEKNNDLRTFVDFLDEEELKRIAVPLNDRAYEVLNELIDRYVDAKMKEFVVNKINLTDADESIDVKLRWLLEFKKFLNNLYGSKSKK